MYNKICEYCRKKYDTSKKKQKYCCPECVNDSKRKQIRCKNCGTFKTIPQCLNHKFCSSDCFHKYNKGENNVQWSRVALTCSNPNCDTEFSRELAYANRNERNYCSPQCQFKHLSGSQHYLWGGGAKTLRNAIRKSKHYDKIRFECYKKDNFKSILSGSKKEIQHHHVDSFSYLVLKHNITIDNVWEFKEILFDINNVVTLTKEEHVKLHKIYGTKTTKENFQEFVENFENLMNNC